MLLSAHIDFDRVLSNKPVSKDKNFVAYIAENNTNTCRLGISIPKSKIKKATTRNKLKRAIRHQFLGLKKERIDIVMVYRGTACKYDAKLIFESLRFHKDNILKLRT